MRISLRTYPGDKVRNAYVFLILPLMLCGLTGILAAILVFRGSPGVIWANILVTNLFLISISLLALIFLSMHVMAGADWIFRLYPVIKPLSHYLPAGIVILLLLMLFGLNDLFQWTDQGTYNELNSFKQGYLNKTFFIARNFIYFTLWLLSGHYLLRYSKWYIAIGDKHLKDRLNLHATLFLLIFVLTFTGFSWDWLLSVNISWYSTLFAWYVIIGAMSGAVSLILLLGIYLRHVFSLQLNDQIIRDLRSYLFTFCIIWIYMWYSQFMLIWYGNLPEEVIFFSTRLEFYPMLFYMSPVLCFAIPFLLLLIFRRKFLQPVLVISAISSLSGQWMDKYLIVMPAYHLNYSWYRIIIEIAMVIGFFAFFMLIVLKGWTYANETKK